MKITFYPYDFDYKLKNGKVLVYLYSKLNDGTKVCVVEQHQPFFFADLKNFDKTEFIQRLQTLSLASQPEPAKVISFEEIEKELIGEKKRFFKIYANYPKAVPILAKEIQSWGIECYEKDVLFIHRYLRDKFFLPMTEIEAEGQYLPDSELCVPKFIASSLRQKSPHTTSWKILAIDIETYSLHKEIDFKNNPILMVAFYGLNEQNEEVRKVITWKKFPANEKYIEIVENEKELLLAVKKTIQEYSPEIITGYFSDGFDFPYLKARAHHHKVTLDLGLDHSELIAGTQGDFREGEAKIKGILHIDILKFIKYIFGKNLKTDSYSLDNVASELLGHQKHIVDLDSLAAVWDRKPELLEPFCAYNLHDARLTYKLCDKLLFDIIEFCKIVGLPLFDVIRMRFSRLVESYIMKRAMDHNVLAPNKPGDDEVDRRMEESIQGGFVYQPTPGLYKDLVVFDFRSLYPTIIVSHNIGPESFRREPCLLKKSAPEKEEYWFCQDQRYFLPLVLEELINRRAEIKKEIKKTASEQEKKLLEARSYALKILANSFYGYLGFFGARWYSLECAASTTAFARYYIKRTIQKGEEKGFKVVYGDTDSCFFQLESKNVEEALNFLKEINAELPGQMELEFEGYFPRGIFVSIKGREQGAKKKYALLRENSTMKVTGFEAVRRNWSLLAKEVQQEVLRLILLDKKEDAVIYVRTLVKDLKQGKIPLFKLVLKTQITRELSQYNAVNPHVLIARQRVQKGERIAPGTIIEYVLVKGSGLIRERAKIPSDVKEGEYDPSYYLYHQIIPAVSSIFSVLGYKEDEIFSDTTQIGLGKFF